MRQLLNAERAVGSQRHAAERELLGKIKTGTEQPVPAGCTMAWRAKRGLLNPTKLFYFFFFNVLPVLLELAGRPVMDLGQMETVGGMVEL